MDMTYELVFGCLFYNQPGTHGKSAGGAMILAQTRLGSNIISEIRARNAPYGILTDPHLVSAVFVANAGLDDDDGPCALY